MVKLDDDDIRHLADLAKIELSPEDIATFKPQLQSILSYVAQLDQVDTAGLKPTSQVTGLSDVVRADGDESDTAKRQALLDQTPDQAQNQIKVPRVIE